MARPFFGYHMPLFTFPGVPDDQLFEHLVSLVQAAEKAGFDMVTVMDHFYQIRGVGPEEAPMLEAYTLLSGLAARTSRVRLGTMVSGVTYRNPALLAKMVTTLDIISGGRAILGLGAAWNEDEHKGYGFGFPLMRERMDRLEEALEICHLMFTEQRPSFQGTYYSIDRALNDPRPIQPGGPKILIGGSGERRTLRMVARFGDISNWFGGLDELKHKNEVFLAHCEAVGRDPSTVTRTVMAPVLLVSDVREAEALLARIPPERQAGLIVATPAAAAEALAPYREAGFDGFILRNPMLSTVESMALAGELIAAMQ